MQDRPSFGSILDKAPSDVERPKPLPVGTYHCVVAGPHKQDKSSKKQTEYVEFTLKIMAAGPEVDEDDLKTALTKADGSVKSLTDQTIRATFYITDDALWRLKKFLTDDLEIKDGDSLRAMLAEAPGRQVMATLKHEASDDGQSTFARLASTAPVE